MVSIEQVAGKIEGYIFDKFFDDAISVRKAIKDLKFIDPDPTGKGGVAWYHRVDTSAEIKGKLENIWGFSITPVYSEYRYSFKNADASRNKHGKKIVCHSDYGTSEYTSVVYLTAPKYCNGGTNFFTHLPSGEKEFIPNKASYNFVDESEWKCYYNSKMAFNRIVTYRSALFHGVRPPFFGSNLSDCRLILTTRFNRKFD